MTLHQSPRILIVRLSAIGDCVLTTALLCALRKGLPDAYLAWVVEDHAAPLLRGHSCLDELIVVPRGWLKSWRTVRRLREQLHARRFDLTLDPQSLAKSSIAAWLSGAKRRIGFDNSRGRELSQWLNREQVPPNGLHPIDCEAQLLRPLGVAATEVEFRLPHDPECEREADRILGALHLRCDFAAVSTGASWNSKLWPARRYGRVAKAIGQRRQLPTLVVRAGTREHGWAREVVAQSGGHAVLAPEVNLRVLAAVLRRAALFVGSDTGPLHIAAAVGTPCVGLHGPTRPEVSGAYGPEHISIQERYHAGSTRRRRAADNSAMCEIRVERVVEACEEILGRCSANSAAGQRQAG